MQQIFSVKCPRSVLWLFFVIVCFLSNVDSRAQAQADPIDWPQIRLADSIDELPPELVAGLPFSLADYYDLDESDNREQLYIQVFVEFASWPILRHSKLERAYVFGEGFHQNKKLQRRLKPLVKSQERVQDFFNKNLRRTSKLKLEQSDLAKYQKIVSRFDPAFEKLEQAQTKPNCFIHRKAVFGHSQMESARFIVTLLRARYALDPQNVARIEELNRVLQMIDDLRPLAESTIQRFCRSMENDCFAFVVKPMLESNWQDRSHLDRLLAVLQAHRRSRLARDPVLESARRYYLLSRSVVTSLRNKAYRNNPVNPPPNYSEPREIMQLIAYISVGTSNQWTASRIENRWTHSTRSTTEIASMLDLAKIIAQNKGAQGSLQNERLVNDTISRLLLGMQEGDYDRDLDILLNRYRYIEAACKQPFPKSTNQLKRVVNEWTTGDRWRQSPLLLWCLCEPLPTRAQLVLQAEAYVGLAAIKRWRLEHKGKNPDTLDDALRAVGIAGPLQDPYSGQPLRMKNRISQVALISYGYNGQDDAADLVPTKRSQKNEFRISLDGGKPDPPEAGNILIKINL